MLDLRGVVASVGSLAWQGMPWKKQFAVVSFVHGPASLSRVVMAPSFLTAENALDACEQIIRRVGAAQQYEYEEAEEERLADDDPWEIPF